MTSEKDALEAQLQRAIDEVRKLAARCDAAIAFSIARPQQAACGVAWPPSCALAVDGETVLGFKPLEAYADTYVAAVAMRDTAAMLLGLLQQSQAVQRQVEAVIAAVGRSMDIEPWRQTPEPDEPVS